MHGLSRKVTADEVGVFSGQIFLLKQYDWLLPHSSKVTLNAALVCEYSGGLIWPNSQAATDVKSFIRTRYLFHGDGPARPRRPHKAWHRRRPTYESWTATTTLSDRPEAQPTVSPSPPCGESRPSLPPRFAHQRQRTVRAPANTSSTPKSRSARPAAGSGSTARRATASARRTRCSRRWR